ncbi:BQ5605_C016g08051 [Microbotryum silenes-dioicae]|uniref:BQ5605_C016g08051 protein n=1 Tax=Microbotryum silenes-dioicae TaxID=796604 RepID=A0A2X0NZ95_9BASI|nr:BQ5605_C016g08051 [Microbotryum silenes-dioicae]
MLTSSRKLLALIVTAIVAVLSIAARLVQVTEGRASFEPRVTALTSNCDSEFQLGLFSLDIHHLRVSNELHTSRDKGNPGPALGEPLNVFISPYSDPNFLTGAGSKDGCLSIQFQGADMLSTTGVTKVTDFGDGHRPRKRSVDTAARAEYKPDDGARNGLVGNATATKRTVAPGASRHFSASARSMQYLEPDFGRDLDDGAPTVGKGSIVTVKVVGKS